MSRTLLPIDDVRRAIHQAGNDRTTLGVLGRFVCGCCGREHDARDCAGGVWTKGTSGALLHHVLICRDCSSNPDGANRDYLTLGG